MAHSNAVSLFIHELPDKTQFIAEQLRMCIFKTFPEVVEKISYNIPYYYFHGPLCYINPVGPAVILGISKGQHIKEVHPYFQLVKKKVGQLIFLKPEEVDNEVVEKILLAAGAFNRMQAQAHERC